MCLVKAVGGRVLESVPFPKRSGPTPHDVESDLNRSDNMDSPCTMKSLKDSRLRYLGSSFTGGGKTLSLWEFRVGSKPEERE